MGFERHRWTYEEVGRIARRAAVQAHLGACLVVLVVLLAEGADFNVLILAAIEMVLFATVPLIVAAVVTEIVIAYFLEKNLPIPLFVRTCVITMELALLACLLLLRNQTAFFGGL